MIGPAVIGAVLGLLCAFATSAIHSEYGTQLKPLYGITNTKIEALLTFSIVTGGTILVFALPLTLKLLTRSRRRP